jgi:hypothetical protein
METVESRMVAYLRQRIDAGAMAVPGSEIMNAVIPTQNPEYRFRAAYRYGLERLLRRKVINGLNDPKGVTYYFFEHYPSSDLVEWISKQ